MAGADPFSINVTAHIYDEEEARLIYEKITKSYNKLLLDFSRLRKYNHSGIARRSSPVFFRKRKEMK